MAVIHQSGCAFPRTTRTTRFVIMVVALAVVWPVGQLSSGPVPTAEAAFPGENGRIAFESNLTGVNNPTGDFEIFTMLPDGSDVRQLTQNAANDRFPAWSPNGKQIAFAGAGDDIYVMNANGANAVPLTSGGGGDSLPAWSPDGAMIAFARFEAAQTNVYTMNANGTNQTKLTATQFNSFPDWSPDGMTIAFESTRDGGFSVYTMQADGATQTRLGPGRDPNWSPDGEKIAFYQQQTGFRNDVMVMNANGTSPVNLTNTPASNEYEPAWAPAGDQLAFITDDANGFGEVWTMGADGGSRVQRTSNAATEESPAWQPVQPNLPIKNPPKFTVGEVIVFSSTQVTPGNPEGDEEIFKLELRLLTGNVLTQLTSNTSEEDTFPEWSPDGSTIVFTRNRGIYTMNADGSSQVRLTQPPAGKIDIQPTWSPDGTKIVFSSDRDGQFRQLFMMRADGSNLTKLTNTAPLQSDGAPDWSPDGTKIVFDRLDGANGSIFSLFTINPDGSGLTQLTFPGEGNSYEPAWSPSGAKIAFIRNATFVYTMTPDGANQRKVVGGPEGPSSPRWSPDGRELVFHGDPPGGGVNQEVYTVKANGTSLTNRTNSVAFDRFPDWSPNPEASALAAAAAPVKLDEGGSPEKEHKDTKKKNKKGKHKNDKHKKRTKGKHGHHRGKRHGQDSRRQDS